MHSPPENYYPMSHLKWLTYWKRHDKLEYELSCICFAKQLDAQRQLQLYRPYARDSKPVCHSAPFTVPHSFLPLLWQGCHKVSLRSSGGKDGTLQRGESLERPQLFQGGTRWKDTAAPWKRGAQRKTQKKCTLPGSSCFSFLFILENNN